MRRARYEIPYEIEYIPSDKLEVLRNEYQKPLNKKRVALIAAHFDERIANEPKVNYRDGHYYVFNGQHTYAARVLLNGGKPLLIRCKVYRNLTKEQEAILFAEQTGFAAMPTPANRLRARLYAGVEEAVAFKKATEQAGFILDLDDSRSNNHIHCINTCLREYRRVGPETYSNALGVIYSAWGGAQDSLLCSIIIGVSEFMKCYAGEFNTQRLISLLSRTDPRELHQKMQSDFKHPGWKKNVFQIYNVYNDGCGGAVLPMKF